MIKARTYNGSTVIEAPLPLAVYHEMAGEQFSPMSGRRKAKKDRKAEKKAAKRAHKIEKKQSKGRYLRSMGKRDERQAKGEATVMLAEQGIVSPHLAEASGKEKFMRGLTNTLGSVMGGRPDQAEMLESGQDFAAAAPDYYGAGDPVRYEPAPPAAPADEPAGYYDEAGDADEISAQMRQQYADPAAASVTQTVNPLNEFDMSKTTKKYLMYAGIAAAVVVIAWYVMKKK